ncbi:MAG: magnesium/cobalt efflux protein, partial [Gammaproteobacteria bacterium]|nr:magnesium/cobalt efflux protein [Gammaproteobacteria bacterium]
YDTIGGVVLSAFGHLPKRNEVIEIDNWRFRVANSDSRRLHLLRVSKVG